MIRGLRFWNRKIWWDRRAYRKRSMRGQADQESLRTKEETKEETKDLSVA